MQVRLRRRHVVWGSSRRSALAAARELVQFRKHKTTSSAPVLPLFLFPVGGKHLRPADGLLVCVSDIVDQIFDADVCYAFVAEVVVYFDVECVNGFPRFGQFLYEP